MFLGLARKGTGCHFFHSAGNLEYPLTAARPRLEPITEQVSIYRDVVNVGIIRKKGKTLLIDSGDASILREAEALGVGSVDRVLYTH